MADWIPTRELEYNELCEYWTLALADPAKITAFGWEAAECTRVAALIAAYTAASYDIVKGNREVPLTAPGPSCTL